MHFPGGKSESSSAIYRYLQISLRERANTAQKCIADSNPSQIMRYIGKEMRRVDGIAKVTGRAKYAAEFELSNLAYGYLTLSEIAKGTITSIDTSEAERAPGVLQIFTHLNAPKLFPALPGGLDNKEFRPLMSPKIVFNGQPIAVAVANTF